MKKFSAVLAVILALVLCVGAMGCGQKKEAISPDKFMEIAEGLGMNVAETDAYSDRIFEKALIATADGGWQAVFLKITSAEDAHAYFDTMKQFVEDMKSGAGSAQTTVRESWASYKQTNDGKYSVVSQIDDTLLYIPPVDAAKCKEPIDALLKALGY